MTRSSCASAPLPSACRVGRPAPSALCAAGSSSESAPRISTRRRRTAYALLRSPRASSRSSRSVPTRCSSLPSTAPPRRSSRGWDAIRRDDWGTLPQFISTPRRCTSSTPRRRVSLPGPDPLEDCVMTTPRTRTLPLRIAIAGAGMISWYHLVAWRNLGTKVMLVAVCDPDGGRAEKRAAEFGIAKVYDSRDAMLDSEMLDALDIASPRETHAAWVEAAVTRGIDVLCQKPMTPSLAQSEALVRKVGDRVRLMVHENWRFRPWYRTLKSWIEA